MDSRRSSHALHDGYAKASCICINTTPHQLYANESVQPNAPGSRNCRSNCQTRQWWSYESRFCWCIAYFSPQTFSETYFSALFNCSTRKFVTKPPLFPAWKPTPPNSTWCNSTAGAFVRCAQMCPFWKKEKLNSTTSLKSVGYKTKLHQNLWTSWAEGRWRNNTS